MTHTTSHSTHNGSVSIDIAEIIKSLLLCQHTRRLVMDKVRVNLSQPYFSSGVILLRFQKRFAWRKIDMGTNQTVRQIVYLVKALKFLCGMVIILQIHT